MNKKLRLMQYNLENFFVFLDKELPTIWPDISEDHWQTLTHSTVKLKPLGKLKRIQALIFEQDPDILILSEVGAAESLDNFNRLFLNSTYQVHLLEGNSDRGIDVGYLVKANLKHKVQLNSHKQRPINFLYNHEIGGTKKSHYFSRDVAELKITDQKTDTPLLYILGVHLKSKLDPNSFDPEGKNRREAELKTLVEIYEEINSKHNDNVPIILAGDFNGYAGSHKQGSEFTELTKQTNLKSVTETYNLPPEDCFTQVIFNSLKKAVPVQIDYIFLDEKYSELIENVYICSYKDNGGLTIPPPKNIEQRCRLPSDHYPTVCDLLLNNLK